MDDVFTAAAAYEMLNRIRWNASFHEISALSCKPVSFLEVYFDCEKVSALVEFEALLKKWVLDDEVTSASSTTSARVEDAGISHADANENLVHTSSEEFINALKMLNDTLDETNLEALRKIGEMSDNPCISEDQIILGVGLHLIHKLTGNSVTDPATNDVECPCGCPGILPSSSDMWIGSSDTLHGELDMMCQGVGVTAAENIPEVTGTEAVDHETEAEECEVDAGTSENKRRQYQVISQAIVFGWTQYNRHRELSPYIPTILIDGKQFGAFVYNPVSDRLLITENPLLFLAQVKKIPDKYSGIFILWLILHHRLFFKKEILFVEPFESKFKQQVKVEHYEKLDTYRDCIKDSTPGLQWGPGGIGIVEKVLEREVLGKYRKRKHSDSDQAS